MELVGIAAEDGDVPNGLPGPLHVIGGLRQPEADQKFLGRAAHALLEELAEVAPVQLAHVRQLLHAELPLVIALHVVDGLLDIEILEPDAVEGPAGGRGLNQRVQKQKQVSHQVKAGRVGVLRHVEHDVPHFLPPGGTLRPVDRLGEAQPGALYVLRRPEAVKLHPDILPGPVLVGDVGADLAGADQEALVRPQVVVPAHAVGVGGVQVPPAGNHIVEQVVIADIGAEGVQGRTLLPAVLVQPEVQKVLVGEDGKGIILHRGPHPFLPLE